MTSQEIVLDAMRSQGKADALSLRSRAADMDGTAIIAEESKVPAFDPTKDYSLWPVGSPVSYGGQVYTLLQPHNAAHYPDSNPGNTPALWSITHTKDPLKAKPFMAPNGTSGMYMKDECCKVDGVVYRSVVDNNAYSPADYAANWEVAT